MSQFCKKYICNINLLVFKRFFEKNVNNINMEKYNCNNCKYARFVYTNKYKLKKIYCKKVGEYINLGRYKNLKYCLYFCTY